MKRWAYEACGVLLTGPLVFGCAADEPELRTGCDANADCPLGTVCSLAEPGGLCAPVQDGLVGRFTCLVDQGNDFGFSEVTGNLGGVEYPLTQFVQCRLAGDDDSLLLISFVAPDGFDGNPQSTAWLRMALSASTVGGVEPDIYPVGVPYFGSAQTRYLDEFGAVVSLDPGGGAAETVLATSFVGSVLLETPALSGVLLSGYILTFFEGVASTSQLGTPCADAGRKACGPAEAMYCRGTRCTISCEEDVECAEFGMICDKFTGNSSGACAFPCEPCPSGYTCTTEDRDRGACQ